MNFTLNVTISLSAETLEVAKLLIGNQKPVGVGGSTPVSLSGDKPSVENGKAARVGKPKPEEQKEETKSDLSVNEGGKMEVKTYTVQEVRAIVQKKAQEEGKREKVKAVTTSFGVSSVTDVPAEKYPEYVAKIEAL